MKALIAGVLAFAILVGAVAFSQPGKPGGGVAVKSEKRNPWTGLTLNNDPSSFQFAIVSDRTGGHRAKVFSRAVARLNLLQPEFVVSVGDLIEGGKKPVPKRQAEWQEFDGYVNQLKMPFFYVTGNHDNATKEGDAMWQERYGRRWYHFVYRDVLFLILATDDPSGAGLNKLSKEQIDYAKQALAANADVRWTLVFLHKPIWTSAALAKTGWLDVEKALAKRPYTVFCGHVHRYRKFVRQGRNYYQLATTGGGSKVRGVPYGEFDHIVWVTMKKDGPVLANILLDSILPEDLKVPESSEKGVTRKKEKVQAVRGMVYHRGVPVAGAQVRLVVDAKAKKGGANADAITEGDGSFVPSTYTAFDGVVPGVYQVAVTLRRSDGPSLLPAKYADPAKSGVTVEVKEGVDELTIELE